MEPTIVGQVAVDVETFRRALVSPVAGPVVVRLVQGGHLGEGELLVAELVQLALTPSRRTGQILSQSACVEGAMVVYSNQ